MKDLTLYNGTNELAATVYESTSASAILIIASATGVKQEFYRKFARYLAENGITVITFDYTGIGRSLRSPIKQLQHQLSDWGRKDLEAVLQYATKHYPEQKKVILGHSIGGQLIGLAPSSPHADKLILVAAQSGYWKYWKGFARYKMWFNWHVLFPTLINMFGYLPSKRVSGMENLPKEVANQWRKWGMHPNYMFGDHGIEATFYEKIASPLTAFSIADDTLAPKEAVDWMAQRYTKAKNKHISLVPADHHVARIGHFGVFKETFRSSLWPVFLKEIL
ncbi:alpha/beta hydrolase family protein [Robertkochia sediminum]|uniref:alpha/beta hydrolase family protein n=1 Tax=Robertkochia sediminum TaxID=2785326 RepID=UPI0019321B56|nr:alpha/beta fold hydrolase [Robertkochia sediminum]MBL7472569.1 alpha/beta fold hydrolase [Robertkochia sediminum]